MNRIDRMEVPQTQMYSGPIPTADELARYEQAFPGIADRIMTLAEKSTESSIADSASYRVTERIVVENVRDDLANTRYDLESSRMGMFLATFIICGMIVSGTAMVLTGHEGAGIGLLAVSAFSGIASVFVSGTRQKNEK